MERNIWNVEVWIQSHIFEQWVKRLPSISWTLELSQSRICSFQAKVPNIWTGSVSLQAKMRVFMVTLQFMKCDSSTLTLPFLHQGRFLLSFPNGLANVEKGGIKFHVLGSNATWVYCGCTSWLPGLLFHFTCRVNWWIEKYQLPSPGPCFYSPSFLRYPICQPWTLLILGSFFLVSFSLNVFGTLDNGKLWSLFSYFLTLCMVVSGFKNYTIKLPTLLTSLWFHWSQWS